MKYSGAPTHVNIANVFLRPSLSLTDAQMNRPPRLPVAKSWTYVAAKAAEPPAAATMGLPARHEPRTSLAQLMRPMPAVAVDKKVTHMSQNCGVFITSSTCTLRATGGAAALAFSASTSVGC